MQSEKTGSGRYISDLRCIIHSLCHPEARTYSRSPAKQKNVTFWETLLYQIRLWRLICLQAFCTFAAHAEHPQSFGFAMFLICLCTSLPLSTIPSVPQLVHGTVMVRSCSSISNSSMRFLKCSASSMSRLIRSSVVPSLVVVSLATVNFLTHRVVKSSFAML